MKYIDTGAIELPVVAAATGKFAFSAFDDGDCRPRETLASVRSTDPELVYP